MALSVAQIVAHCYSQALQEPLSTVVVMTKDQRTFFTETVNFGLPLVLYAAYQTKRGAWFKRGHFEPSGWVTDGTNDYPLFRQRPGRTEPRFTQVPATWTPVERTTLRENSGVHRPVLKQRKRPNPWTQDSAFFKELERQKHARQS